MPFWLDHQSSRLPAPLLQLLVGLLVFARRWQGVYRDVSVHDLWWDQGPFLNGRLLGRQLCRGGALASLYTYRLGLSVSLNSHYPAGSGSGRPCLSRSSASPELLLRSSQGQAISVVGYASWVSVRSHLVSGLWIRLGPRVPDFPIGLPRGRSSRRAQSSGQFGLFFLIRSSGDVSGTARTRVRALRLLLMFLYPERRVQSIAGAPSPYLRTLKHRTLNRLKILRSLSVDSGRK